MEKILLMLVVITLYQLLVIMMMSLTLQIRTSLTFPVTSDLDESVIVCMNAGMQLTCQVTVHSLLKVSINYIW